MIKFEDGKIIALSVEQNITRYYNALAAAFPNSAPSFNTFKGSREYEVAYMAAQKDRMDAILIVQAFNSLLLQVAEVGAEILTADTLQFRLQDAFSELGYVAFQNPDATAGTMELAISRWNTDGDEIDLALGGDDIPQIISKIAKSVLPNGVVMVNDAAASSTGDSGANVIDTSYSTSKGNVIPVKFVVSKPADENRDIHFRVTVDPKTVAPSGWETTARTTLYDRYYEDYRLGREITPQQYLTIADLTWAKSVLVEYEVVANGDSIGSGTEWVSDNSTNYTDYHPEYWEEFNIENTSSFIEMVTA